MAKRNVPILIVQGGCYGSEAKGAVAAHLCLDRKVDIAVRTGAINAGHTVVYKGQAYAMQQLPVGWVNPNTKLVIGAGAYIHPDTLWREVDMVNRAMPESDVRDRLFIDYRCGLHGAEAEAASKAANRHHAIGATGKGCSEAIVSKIRDRNQGYQLFRDTQAGRTYLDKQKGKFVDTCQMLNGAIDGGAQVLVEGTQGTGLDLHLGPYPYTTSRMTSAANWIAECGLSPALEYEVVLVVRTYPIRVAGNSGPMAREIEWADLARTLNGKLEVAGRPPLVDPKAIEAWEEALRRVATSARYPVPMGSLDRVIRPSAWTAHERDTHRVAASEMHRDALALLPPETVTELRKLFEMTTVTRKLRRLAEMHLPDLRVAVAINRPAWIALTFADYVEPVLAGATIDSIREGLIVDPELDKALDRLRGYMAGIQLALGVPVRLFGTGPAPGNLIGVDKHGEF